MASRRILRERILTHLKNQDFSALTALAGQEKGVAELLLQFLYNPYDLMHWRALEGLGHVAEAHPEQVQKVISRLLWLLNEDSGSFGWGAAAALGEIGRHNLSVVAHIVPMFCGFLEEPFSRAPMLWGLGRLAARHPGELEEVIPFILPCLADDDPQVRGLAVWVLGRLREPEARDRLRNLLGDESPVELYDQGELRQSSVAQLTREALAALE